MRLSRQSAVLILIILTGLFLRVRLSMDSGLHKWDERFHALVAKNVASHPLKPTLYDAPALPYDYRQWYANHVWLHKPPLPLWIIAGALDIFGISEFVVRLPSILLSTFAIYLTFILGKRLFSFQTGLLAAFFCAINGLLIEMASGRVTTDHYDTMFLTFVLAGILTSYYDSIHNKFHYRLLAGLFVGLALLTKWLPALIVLPVYLSFLFDKGHGLKQIAGKLGTVITIAALIAIPWQIFINIQYPLEAKWESHYNWLHFTQELEGHADKDGVLYYFHMLRINYSEIIYLPLIFLFYKLRHEPRNLLLWALTMWIFIPFLIFSAAKMKLQGYMLFTAPALFIITADFYYKVKVYAQKTSLARSHKILLKALLLVIIALPLRYCFERTAFGFLPPGENSFTAQYKNLRGQVPEKAVVLNVQEPFEFMFFNGGTAYQQDTLLPHVQQGLLNKGYQLFMYDQNAGTLKRY